MWQDPKTNQKQVEIFNGVPAQHSLSSHSVPLNFRVAANHIVAMRNRLTGHGHTAVLAPHETASDAEAKGAADNPVAAARPSGDEF